MARRYVFLIAFLLVASNLSAQQTLPLEKRLFIFAKTYAAIPLYFAHWQDAPDLNLDSLYQAYLPRVIEAKTRKAFALTMMAFMAHLNNAHSWYADRHLRSNTPPLGFYVTDYQGQWVVTRSQIPELPVGEIITHINRKPMEEWYQTIRPYINASSERERRMKFSYYRFLFPDKLTITTASGKRIPVDRTQLPPPQRPQVSGRWIDSTAIAYIKIPSFTGPQYEAAALNLVKRFQQARTLIIDLRGNGGGITPSRLTDALQDRPYRFWTESTPVTFGLFKAYAQLYQLFGNQLPESEKSFLESVSQTFNRPHLIWTAQWNTPDSTLFTGKLIFLTDRRCASACEDFIVPFKDNHRAILIGETTMGSSGQPFIFPFDESISIAIGTKREYLPDGSPFEGRGIAPDIPITPTVSQIKMGKDPVLERAIALARQ